MKELGKTWSVKKIIDRIAEIERELYEVKRPLLVEQKELTKRLLRLVDPEALKEWEDKNERAFSK